MDKKELLAYHSPYIQTQRHYGANDYKTIMISHIFTKLYATTLDLYLSNWFERRSWRGRDQASFGMDYQIEDHIFNLSVVIEEAKQRSSKNYCCFVNFQKSFDIVPTQTLLLCQHSVGSFHTSCAFSKSIKTTIGVNQGYPLSPTLFVVYINEIK
jgi:hypothetical protein